MQQLLVRRVATGDSIVSMLNNPISDKEEIYSCARLLNGRIIGLIKTHLFSHAVDYSAIVRLSILRVDLT